MLNKESLLTAVAYIFVGSLSVMAALWATSGFFAPSKSQAPEEVVEEVMDEGAPPEMSADSELDRQQISADIQGFLEPFIYDPQGRRDPFRSYTEVQGSSGIMAPIGPLLPLQRFDLDQLKLIGIIWDVRDPKAMFQDPNEKIYTVGKEERVGRNNGYIAAIREGEVVVIETLRGREGEPIYSPRIIRMER